MSYKKISECLTLYELNTLLHGLGVLVKDSYYNTDCTAALRKKLDMAHDYGEIVQEIDGMGISGPERDIVLKILLKREGLDKDA